MRPVTSTGDKGTVRVPGAGRRSPVMPAAWAPGLACVWGAGAGTCWLYCGTPRGGWWPSYLVLWPGTPWPLLLLCPHSPLLSPRPAAPASPSVQQAPCISASLAPLQSGLSQPHSARPRPRPLRVCCQHPVCFLHCVLKTYHHLPGSLVTGSPYMGALGGQVLFKALPHL